MEPSIAGHFRGRIPRKCQMVQFRLLTIHMATVSARQTDSIRLLFPLKSRILERLASEPTLEAWSEKLIYVPEKYMDNDGIPLTLTISKHNVYISHSYSHDDYEHLKLLNVVEMGDSLFLDHLEEITKHQRDYFVKRPPEWHSRLAAVLAEIWEAPQTENRRRIFTSVKEGSAAAARPP
jgi:hypothetical protein